MSNQLPEARGPWTCLTRAVVYENPGFGCSTKPSPRPQARQAFMAWCTLRGALWGGAY